MDSDVLSVGVYVVVVPLVNLHALVAPDKLVQVRHVAAPRPGVFPQSAQVRSGLLYARQMTVKDFLRLCRVHALGNAGVVQGSGLHALIRHNAHEAVQKDVGGFVRDGGEIGGLEKAYGRAFRGEFHSAARAVLEIRIALGILDTLKKLTYCIAVGAGRC